MKKLFLIPMTVVTALLVLSFLMPARATTVVQSVVSAAHLSLPPVLTARDGNVPSTAAGPADNSQTGSSSNGSSSSARSSSPDDSANTLSPLAIDRGRDLHAVATAAHPNCGRYGGGTHGGKHAFACDNKFYPEPAT